MAIPLEPPPPSALPDSGGHVEAPSPAAVPARVQSLADSLAGFTGPAYRRAYLAQLHRSAADFLASGKQRAADHLFGKIEAELKAATQDAGSRAGGDSRGPEATHGASAPVMPNPLEGIGPRWQAQRMASVEDVLNRHAFRLTSLERKLYRDTLAKWKTEDQPAAPKSAPPRSMARIDSALLELRRKLYNRILKSQKAGLARGTEAPSRQGQAKTGIIGPYNDRHNLEGVFALLGQVDRAWVEEFLELYSGLSRLKAMIPANR